MMAFLCNIKINVFAQNCTANFSYSTNEKTVDFTNLSSGIHAHTTYLWDFGDGNTSTQIDPKHTYSQYGSYLITLLIYDSVASCVDFLVRGIQVNRPLTCFANFSKIPHPMGGFTFEADSGNYHPSAYIWDFGSGGIRNGSKTHYFYDDLGDYSVCLNVNRNGCNATFCDSVKVREVPPKCISFFSFEKNGLTIRFLNQSENGTNYLWDFGDGFNSNLKNPIHTYSLLDSFEVCLLVTDSINNCSNQYCKKILIDTFSNNKDVSFRSVELSNGSFQFLANQFPNSNQIFYWDFGDGTKITGGSNIKHRYSNSGFYTVCLTSISSLFGRSNSCQSIEVNYVSPCQANFSSVKTPKTLKENFTDLSVGADQYHWDFGDGNISNQQNPHHFYTQKDTFEVQLSISNLINSCQDNFTKTIYTDSISNCWTTFNYIAGVNGNVDFEALTSDSANQYQWDFGDENLQTSQNTNISHTYLMSGKYNVCLSVQTANCSQTFCDSILAKVPANCLADFSYQSGVHNSVQFTNLSTSNGQLNYIWDFGDGSLSSQKDPNHFYAQEGNYQVCLEVSDPGGSCVDSICKNLKINTFASIEGSVFNGPNLASSGQVYLVEYKSNQQLFAFIDTAQLNQGFYKFDSLPYGEYFVKAHLGSSDPNFSQFLPTYFHDTLFWQSAPAISLNVSSPLVYNISMTERNLPANGSGFIGGTVFEIGLRKVKNIPVLLLDPFNRPLQYDISQENGNYRFLNLPYGSYKIVVDITGKRSSFHFVSINPNLPALNNLNFIINQSEIILDAENPIFKENSRIYPNPTTGFARIDIETEKALDLEIKVLDLLGKELSYKNQSLTVGKNQIDLDLNHLSNGIYFIEIESKNQKIVYKIVKI